MARDGIFCTWADPGIFENRQKTTFEADLLPLWNGSSHFNQISCQHVVAILFFGEIWRYFQVGSVSDQFLIGTFTPVSSRAIAQVTRMRGACTCLDKQPCLKIEASDVPEGFYIRDDVLMRKWQLSPLMFGQWCTRCTLRTPTAPQYFCEDHGVRSVHQVVSPLKFSGRASAFGAWRPCWYPEDTVLGNGPFLVVYAR